MKTIQRPTANFYEIGPQIGIREDFAELIIGDRPFDKLGPGRCHHIPIDARPLFQKIVAAIDLYEKGVT
jgi:hypothetical protein